MLRLLGLEQAAQEAAEAAAALQKQQAQARARRTSSQKISQPLAGGANGYIDSSCLVCKQHAVQCSLDKTHEKAPA